MDPGATWSIITDPATDPQERRDAALNLLVWYANGGYHGGASGAEMEATRIAACEAVIIAEFEYADRLANEPVEYPRDN